MITIPTLIKARSGLVDGAQMNRAVSGCQHYAKLYCYQEEVLEELVRVSFVGLLSSYSVEKCLESGEFQGSCTTKYKSEKKEKHC